MSGAHFPLIDAHVHFFDTTRLRYPWLEAHPAINRSADHAAFFAAAAPALVEKLVFVEAGAAAGLHIAEARFAQELAAADPRIAGLVAHAPVEKGDAVEEDLQALLALPALRGIRRLIQGEADPGICLEPAFIAGVRRLARHNLTFDLCVKSWALGYALELARRCPEVTFILDHIGKPDIRHGLRAPWWGQMRELAALENVSCKISGVITEARQPGWRREDLTPYVAHAIDCFGFGRVLFGGDWPVSALTHDYGTWLGLVREVIQGSSTAEAQALFHGNAARLYRLA
jgi:L-fuconolactonase